HSVNIKINKRNVICLCTCRLQYFRRVLLLTVGIIIRFVEIFYLFSFANSLPKQQDYTVLLNKSNKILICSFQVTATTQIVGSWRWNNEGWIETFSCLFCVYLLTVTPMKYKNYTVKTVYWMKF
ncbi:hypothetical protein C0J52_01854, partial [Blattella germanica]